MVLEGNAWLALTKESTLEPEIPICDPHHHFWEYRPEPAAYQRYLLQELAEDLNSGHNVRSTVFIEVHCEYRQDGPDDIADRYGLRRIHEDDHTCHDGADRGRCQSNGDRRPGTSRTPDRHTSQEVTHAEEDGGQGPQEDDHRGMLPSPPRAPVTGEGGHADFARTDVDHPTLP